MNHIKSYLLFNEARLSDVVKIIGNNGLFNVNTDINDDDFLKYKTISKRDFNNKKIRLNINWNDTERHDLKKRILERTTIKHISEINKLISDGLDELYGEYYEYIKEDGEYSLWYSEYNFSIIIKIIYNVNIIIKTILAGQRTENVKNIIEIKTKL